MNRDKAKKQPARLSRRLVLYAAGLLFLWPLIRFLGFKVPRKPKIVEVVGTFQNNRFIARDDFIIFTDDRDTWAVTRTCTHLGCRLNFKENEGYLECPCHQSRFTPRGDLVRGPAQNSLTRYPVKRTDNSDTYLITIT